MRDRPIQAKVVSTNRLDRDEKVLLEEIASLRKDALENVRTSFRQLITLNTAVIGLYVGLLKATNPANEPSMATKALILSSFITLFASLLLSIFGQISKKIDLSNVDIISKYWAYRDSSLQRGYKIYTAAIILFTAGLLTFVIDFLTRSLR
jgi:hypothetical protein